MKTPRARCRRSRISSLGVLTSLLFVVACGSGGSANAVASCEGQGCGDAGATWGGPPVTSTGGDAQAPSQTSSSDADALPDGVYVSPTGAVNGDGTARSPMNSIAAGLAAAASSHKPVILCSATFTEAIALKAGATIRGGFDCAHEWRATTDRATIAPPKGTPLTIRDVADPIVIERVVMKAPDTTDVAANSIAVLVSNASNVSFDRVELTAGNAGDGSSTSAPAPTSDPAPNGANGGSVSRMDCQSAGGTCAVVAMGGSSSPPGACGGGGAGGGGGNVGRGVANVPGGEGAPWGFGGAGGQTVHTYPEQGRPGRDGDVGASGPSAVSGMGTVTVDGYVASNTGGDGQPGSPGGGGGGGSGGYSAQIRCGDLSSPSFWIGGGGAQGGFGGCGGASAKGAGAGGASIALLTINSHVVIKRSTLNAALGGRGGDSAQGAPGQAGGQGGSGGTSSVLTTVRCAPAATEGAGGDGGPGGRGGKGGPGGAGGGGPSIALLASGIAPQTEALTFNVGKAGKGGRAVSGQDGADGVTGELITLGVADAGTN